MAIQRMDATIEQGGLVVLTPDPLVPFANSSYSQRLRFVLSAASGMAPGASAVIVDWLGAGRVAQGERWAFKDYRSRVEVVREDDELIESLSLRGSEAFLGAMGFDACLTIFALGPLAEEVVTQLQIAATWLAGRSGARVSHVPSDMPKLTGRAVMGLTKLSDGAVARLMAEKTEDVYRILHHCLSPLSQHLGVEPYADRVHGIESLPETPLPTRTSAVRTEGAKEMVGLTLDLDLKRALTLCQLTDATLPVGGFAHSNGIEAASQLGLCESEDVESLRTLVVHGARSMLRLQGYFVKAAHQLGGEEELDSWKTLDLKLHAYLASNGVASRASSSQGAGLVRVGRHWRTTSTWPKKGHYATAFGLLAARLDLDQATTLQAFAFSTVRDSISAAVRLNLLGPLLAVELQASILKDLEEDILELISADACISSEDPALLGKSKQTWPASCAPLLDCVHSGHDLLEARLFLT